MENTVSKAINDVIYCITNSDDYKKCILIKNQMSCNEELVSLIELIKSKQKDFIRSGDSESSKNELDDLNKKLNSYPIYVEYLKSLDKVNAMIDIVHDDLNNYFYNIFNE